MTTIAIIPAEERFTNWLSHSKQYLKETEEIIVYAENLQKNKLIDRIIIAARRVLFALSN
jgi:hypothetical protein